MPPMASAASLIGSKLSTGQLPPLIAFMYRCGTQRERDEIGGILAREGTQIVSCRWRLSSPPTLCCRWRTPNGDAYSSRVRYSSTAV
jgi:hypothetical protein